MTDSTAIDLRIVEIRHILKHAWIVNIVMIVFVLFLKNFAKEKIDLKLIIPSWGRTPLIGCNFYQFMAKSGKFWSRSYDQVGKTNRRLFILLAWHAISTLCTFGIVLISISL